MSKHGAKPIELWHRAACIVWVGVSGALTGCETLSAPADAASSGDAPDLPADLLAACPEAEAARLSKRACTEIGCSSGFTLSVTPREGWPAGAYRFVVHTDADVTTCIGSLPLPACETRGIRCDSDKLRIGESGCALPPETHAFGDIQFTGFPRDISLEVSLDDKPVVQVKYQPKYTFSQPNGSGCGPICCSASDALTVEPGTTGSM